MVKLEIKLQITDELSTIEITPIEKLADVLSIFASNEQEGEEAKKLAERLMESLKDINDFLG